MRVRVRGWRGEVHQRVPSFKHNGVVGKHSETAPPRQRGNTIAARLDMPKGRTAANDKLTATPDGNIDAVQGAVIGPTSKHAHSLSFAHVCPRCVRVVDKYICLVLQTTVQWSSRGTNHGTF